MSESPLVSYYREQSFCPTYCGELSQSFLMEHEKRRRDIFYRLRLPYEMFEGLRVLEFGPGSGENSMVLTLWGADLHLVEPVTEFADIIRQRYAQFALELPDISPATFEAYDGPKHDFVLAEGFVNYTGPAEYWVPRLCQFGDWVMFSHDEKAGYTIEQLQADCAQALAKDRGISLVEAAKILFWDKWHAIPHLRSFGSWVMDTLTSELDGIRRLVGMDELLELFRDEGFFLWASWPPLPVTDVTWVKKPLDNDITKQQEAYRNIGDSLFWGSDDRPPKGSVFNCKNCLKEGDFDRVIAYFGRKPLSTYWGSPNMYSVWRRL